MKKTKKTPAISEKKLPKPWRPRGKKAEYAGVLGAWNIYEALGNMRSALNDENKCENCGKLLSGYGVCSKKCNDAWEATKEAKRLEEIAKEEARKARIVATLTVGELEEILKKYKHYCD